MPRYGGELIIFTRVQKIYKYITNFNRFISITKIYYESSDTIIAKGRKLSEWWHSIIHSYHQRRFYNSMKLHEINHDLQHSNRINSNSSNRNFTFRLWNIWNAFQFPPLQNSLFFLNLLLKHSIIRTFKQFLLLKCVL